MDSLDLRRWLMWEIHKQTLRLRKKKRRGPVRNWKYRAWIRTLPCAACGSNRLIEAAHTGGHGYGQKSSDYTCIPLCAEHHRTGQHALHKIGPRSFERQFYLSIPALVRRLFRCWLLKERAAA